MQIQQSSFRQSKLVYELEDYEYLRVYKCINQVGRKLMQTIFEWGCSRPLDETLKEYLQKKIECSTHSYIKRYDESLNKLIEDYDVHMGEKFDVSMLYKLIQDTSYNIAPEYDKVWLKSNPSQLEYLLYSLKRTRNKIAHNHFSLDKASAHQAIEECRNLFLDLIEAAGIRYGKDVAIEKSCLNNAIDEIISYPLMDYEIQQIFREQFHERSKEKLVIEGVQELKEKYKFQSHLNPLNLVDGTNFILPVKNVYKKLEIRDCGRYSKNLLIDNNDILRLNELCEIVTDLKEAVDLVILQGPTGSGKTTITKLLLAEWSTDSKSFIKGLFDYDFLIYMECRNHNNESLKDLLYSLMPSTCNKLDEDPIKTLSSCSALIIIDSLDEANEHSENLVRELLELMKMKNVTGICTMRPTKTQEVFALVPSELKRVHLESRGIPDDQRGSFVELYHEELCKQGKSEQSTQELKQYLSRFSIRLQEHLRYPINLVHLVYLWAIEPQKVKFVTTPTDLYSNIYEAVQIKLSERLINNSLTEHLTKEDCNKQILKFLDAMYIEALLNLTWHNFCILPKESERVLNKVCKENSLPQCEMLSAFLVTKSLWTGLTVETQYSISHTDMQEYLAAHCIFNAVKDHNFLDKLETRIYNNIQSGSFSIDTLKRSLLRSTSKTPVTDVLKMLFPHSEIPLKDYQNVLKHLSSIFVLNKESISKNVAKDLVKLFKRSGMEQPEDWLDIYAEARSDKFMNKYLSPQCGDMLKGDIIIKDSHLAAYAVLLNSKSSQSSHKELLPVVRADSLMIKVNNPPPELPDLKTLMPYAVNQPCNVEVHLCHNWRKPQPGVIDSIFDETHISCNLKVVRGSPSSYALQAISSTLEKLYISICDDNHARDILAMLNSTYFPKLRAIYIHLKCSDVFSEALLPLNLCQSTTIVLFLSDVDDRGVAWAVDVARALQIQNGEYHCLYLPNNQLTSSGFLNFVESLYQNNVKILVHLGVTSDIYEKELDEALDAATRVATNQLHCDLLWYFCADRMEGW